MTKFWEMTEGKMVTYAFIIFSDLSLFIAHE